MRTRLTALAGALALALAGCGGDGEPEAVPTDAPEAAPTEDEPAAPPTATGEGTDEPTTGAEPGAAAGAPAVEVAQTDLGEVLVDGEGMVLYMFDSDMQGDSVCYDQCEQAWPPLVTEGEPTAGEGVDAALLGTVERQDGSMQVTYDDWPLYYYAQDAEPGDTAGQAVNDVWWVLDPAGQPIRE